MGRLIRLGLLGAAVLLALVATTAVIADSRPAAVARHESRDGWVTSWSASPQVAAPGTLAAAGFDNQTVRDIILSSVGGDPIRLELTNVFGASPLRVGHVTVAAAGPGAAVQPGTMHPVTYRGSASFQIPAGGQVLSDPVAMRVGPLQDLAVSVYLPGRTGAATFHADAQQVNWVSAAGDHAADSDAGEFTIPTLSWYYVSGLIVQSSEADGTVVALGDSITDGVGSTAAPTPAGPTTWPAGWTRWPAPRSRWPTRGSAATGCSSARGAAGPAPRRGSGGTPWTSRASGTSSCLRGSTTSGSAALGDVSAAQIIAGYQRLIAQAHARGLRIFGATLLPFQGAGYYTAAGEATREAVNTWIRTSGAFDGVVDFDAVMRDPADPLRLNPAYDSGDHLHPDDAGYQAMADAISLRMLLPQSS